MLFRCRLRRKGESSFVSRAVRRSLARADTVYIFLSLSETERPKNPMVELFYGHFLAVGVLEGETRSG